MPQPPSRTSHAIFLAAVKKCTCSLLSREHIRYFGKLSKSLKIYVELSMTCAIFYFLFTLELNYITVIFPLASSLSTNRDLLCAVLSQGYKSEQKHGTKLFLKFYNHFPLLNMAE